MFEREFTPFLKNQDEFWFMDIRINFIEIKVPTLVNQEDAAFEDTFYDDGNGESNLDPTSNYNVSFKLIDRVENNASVDYIYSGEETNFTIAREDEFQDFIVTVQEASDGDYFEIFGEKDNSIGDFSAYILNRITTSSDDISVIYDIVVNEQVGTSYTETYSTSITQTQHFDEPIIFRPVIKNANNSASFILDITMRIYNQTDNTQIVKRGSLISNNPAKYGKKMMKVNINSTANLTRVYNTLPDLQATRNTAQVLNASLPKAQVKYVPAFTERVDVTVNAMDAIIEDGQLTGISNSTGATLNVPPFDNYIKFKISRIEDGMEKDLDMSQGELLFKIDKANAAKVRGLNNKKYYISLDNGSTETMVYKGDFVAV